MARSLQLPAVVAATALLSVSAACSGSAKSASTTATAASGPAATAVRSSPVLDPSAVAAAWSAVLRAVIVQPAELPAGWASDDHRTDPDEAALQNALVRCVGGRDTRLDRIVDVHSPDYSRGTASVTSAAASFKSPDDVAANVDVLANPKISSCYRTLVQTRLAKSLPTGTTINSVTFNVTLGPSGGPPNLAATGSGDVNITANGQPADLFLDIAFITGHAVEAQVTFESEGAPFPAALRDALVSKVAYRAAAAHLPPNGATGS
jgi:hypothetical protein